MRSSSSTVSAVNSFAGFGSDRAKQFVPCTPDGYVIGDVILFHLGGEQVQPGRPRTGDELGDRTTPRPATRTSSVELDERTRAADRRPSPQTYRFQVQGPNAMKVIEKAARANRRPS